MKITIDITPSQTRLIRNALFKSGRLEKVYRDDLSNLAMQGDENLKQVSLENETEFFHLGETFNDLYHLTDWGKEAYC